MNHNHHYSAKTKYLVLTSMALALAVVFFDQSAIAIALPPIRAQFHLSHVMLQWVVNAYLLSIAALVIFCGKLGDLLGHKKIFLIGISIFMLSSIGCALANTGQALILSRTIQGIGGALIIPVTAPLIAHVFKDYERGKAMGIYISIASIFLTIGPLLSGILVHYLNWHWIFLINVPISLISILIAIFAVPNEEKKPTLQHLDWFGFFIFSIFITSLVFALMEGVNLGWGSVSILSLFLIALIFCIIFIVIEWRVTDPIVYLSLFKQKVFVSTSLCLFLFTCAFSAQIFFAILFQSVMGYSALISGLFYLPATLPIMFLAPFGGLIRDKYGPRLPALIGTLCVTVASFWIAGTTHTQNYFWIFPGILLIGIGSSLVYSPCMATAISAVPIKQIGMASGIANGIRQVARVFGIALLGSIISNIEQHYISELSFIFGLSLAMIAAGILSFLAFIAAFGLPNRPLSPK